MAPGFASLDIAVSALRAHQKALEVTGQNIANANTDGYSRRRVSIVSANPALVRTGQANVQMGTGVAATVQRLRDSLVDLQVRKQATTLGYWETLRDALQHVETVFGEPSDVGLNNLMTVFFNRWEDLSNDPESMAARANLRESSDNLAEAFKWIYGQLRSVRQDLNQRIQVGVQDINVLADQIASLNGQVAKASAAGEDTGDIRDQRDRLLDELAGLVEISYFEDNYGSVTVSLSGRNLVSRTSTTSLATTPDPLNGNLLAVEWADGLSSLSVQGGKLKAALELRDVTIANMMAEQDAIAAALVTEVNAVHSAGFGLNGATGVSFFTGTGAEDIALTSDVVADLANIAAASAASSPGDGSNALALAGLRSALLMNAGTATISDYYLHTIVQLGAEALRSNDQAESQALIAQNISHRREQFSGVSLDEEAVDLIRYQRAYEAAARLVNVIDGLLDKIINSLGTSGR
ncbi:MAG: flagellar hook-associated protein FlgK [Chloroflexota bacterium]